MVPRVSIAHPGLLSYEVSVAANTVWRRYIDRSAQGNCSNSEHEQGRMHTAARHSFVSRNFTSDKQCRKWRATNSLFFTGIEETPTTDRDKNSSSSNPPSSPNEILWSAVQQHRHLGAIPFSYGSHLRDWTYDWTDFNLMSYEFWGRDVMPHKLVCGFWYARCCVEPPS